MSTRVRWTGLEELEEGLLRIPGDVDVEAERIIQGEANAAAVQARSRYPVRTGNLRNHVTVTRTVTKHGEVSYVVKSTARHARIFEYGSMTRKTALGAPNPMPPGKVFIPIMIQRRRMMLVQLRALLVRMGFVKVRGDA